jgi:hypothetical protein
LSLADELVSSDAVHKAGMVNTLQNRLKAISAAPMNC